MSAFLQPADWSFPAPIRYGPGRLAELGDFCANRSMRRVLLVTDRGSADLPFIGTTREILRRAGIESAVFSEVSPNPTDRNIAAGKAFFRAGGYHGVVAMGGGSGMDAGKAISLVAHNDTDLWAFEYGAETTGGAADMTADDFPALVCVPTTAGTGAETASTAMLTDSVRGVKRCVWHAAQQPALALLDPQLTLGLPKNLTAWTGCDALVHAIEALSVPDWHPLCDGVALEAIRLIHRHLPVAVRDGADLEARGAMLAGSCLAGVSFVKGLGLVHAMSHMVGAVCDTHHGLTNAVLLPGVLRYNRHALGEKTALMSRAMCLPGEDFDGLYRAICALLDELEIPRGLDALGVPQPALAEIAAKAHTDAARATNPVAATVRQIQDLLEESLTHAR